MCPASQEERLVDQVLRSGVLSAAIGVTSMLRGCALHRSSAALGSGLLLAFAMASAGASARSLTFEERVAAQEAIERIYYSHQIGATQPFEDAVPREVLERKVETYLKESLALERFWGAPLTAPALPPPAWPLLSSSPASARLQPTTSAALVSASRPLPIEARPTWLQACRVKCMAFAWSSNRSRAAVCCSTSRAAVSSLAARQS